VAYVYSSGQQNAQKEPNLLRTSKSIYPKKCNEFKMFGNDSKDKNILSLCSPRRHVGGVEV